MLDVVYFSLAVKFLLDNFVGLQEALQFIGEFEVLTCKQVHVPVQRINLFFQRRRLIILLTVDPRQVAVVMLQLVQLAFPGLHSDLDIRLAYFELLSSANFVLQSFLQLALSLGMFPVLFFEVADFSVKLLQVVLEARSLVFV